MIPVHLSTQASERQPVGKPSNEFKHPQGSTEKFEGFEFLRAIFSIVVVALKSNLFLITEILISSTFAYFLIAEFAYLAVPVFVQMSLFLFYFKSSNAGMQYFLKKRLPKLVYLYLFWVGLKILVDVVNQDFHIKDVISSPKVFMEFIVSGDTSPFFFFFSLIFLSTSAAVLSVLLKKVEGNPKKLAINYFLLFLSCTLIFVLSMVEVVVTHFTGQTVSGLTGSISSLVAWDYNPISFLPYLFTAAIVAQEVNEKKIQKWSSALKLKAYSLLFLSAGFSVLEWHFFEQKLHYSRLSLVFSSWLLLYWAVLSPRKAPSSIRFLASCSLGIYGFHVFFTQYFPLSKFPALEVYFQTMPGVEVLANFLTALVCSIGLTLLFRRIRGLKNFV